MKRYLLTSLTLLIIPLTFPKITFASSNFVVDANVEYKVNQDGGISVTNAINLINTTSESYAKSFVLNLSSIEIHNLKVYEAGLPLKATLLDKPDQRQLKVDFSQALAGVNKSRTFVITFEADNLVEKTGDIWEVAIPRLDSPETFRKYNVTVSIPKVFGNEAYVSPEPRNTTREDDRTNYFFEKDEIKTYGIVLGFGQSQVYELSLNYHLENPLKKKTTTQIAIPPDTSLQKVYYEKIEPRPITVSPDADGNWLASFNLSPRQRLDVAVKGAVQIFAKPRKFLPPSASTLLANTKPGKYWQSDDAEIKELAQRLKAPQEIYKYITKTLTYDISRVKPESSRLGAKEALANPRKAICTEFTDAFVALSRAAGIPAREIEGFAYTQNRDLQPLSLVADVLHAWPEYWDSQQGVWVGLDPTWGATSKVDYFQKLDMRHITFVIHGQNPVEPYPPGSYKFGSNPQKDVFVSIGEIPKERTSSLQIRVEHQKTPFLLAKKAYITIQNNSSVAIYDVTYQVTFDEKIVKQTYIEVLPPFAKFETDVKIPYGILGTKAPAEVKVSAYRSEVKFPTNKTQAIINQLVFFCIVLITSLGIVYRKTSKKLLNLIIFNLKSAAQNIHAKATAKIKPFDKLRF